MRGQDLR